MKIFLRTTLINLVLCMKLRLALLFTGMYSFFADTEESDVSRDYKNINISVKEGALEKEEVGAFKSHLLLFNSY